MLEKKLDDCVLELDSLKQKQLVENNNIVKLKCSVGAIHFDSGVSLRQHIREKHHKDQVSQTRTSSVEDLKQTDDNTENLNCEYPCFYCGENVNSSKENASP